ncbi:unnamed protein product [Callosobruchus maculatus]|uniref:Uncharacterized protein n=1 Tax=Callosobruchus maculatus TaxID=64391 RepID=A0A653D0F8_CALMS|nr:unnamed protein product [Callosobruchus maculatus]
MYLLPIDNTHIQRLAAQIRPSLEYCSHVWGCVPKHPLRLLDTIQKRPIILIDSIDTPNILTSQRTSKAWIIDEGWLTYPCFRFYHGICSSELSQIITPKAVRTRNSTEALGTHPYQVEIPTPGTSPLQYSFFWRTSTLWNELPGNLFPDGYNLHCFPLREADHKKPTCTQAWLSEQIVIRLLGP